MLPRTPKFYLAAVGALVAAAVVGIVTVAAASPKPSASPSSASGSNAASDYDSAWTGAGADLGIGIIDLRPLSGSIVFHWPHGRGNRLFDHVSWRHVRRSEEQEARHGDRRSGSKPAASGDPRRFSNQRGLAFWVGVDSDPSAQRIVRIDYLATSNAKIVLERYGRPGRMIVEGKF